VVTNIVLAVALVMFFEGVLYALFPDGMKRMMKTALETPSHILRIIGLGAAILGVLTAWIAHS